LALLVFSLFGPLPLCHNACLLLLPLHQPVSFELWQHTLGNPLFGFAYSQDLKFKRILYLYSCKSNPLIQCQNLISLQSLTFNFYFLRHFHFVINVDHILLFSFI
jgi:hypothetical protein